MFKSVNPLSFESKDQITLLITSVICSITILLLASLYYNDGNLFYTLDDPYIHLALAEHIARGHYGLNYGEFASPSSSVLWPFLLVPAVYLFAGGNWFPLIINIIACLLTATLLQRTLRHVYVNHSGIIAFGLLFLVNGIGLVFTGMEHSLQTLVAVAIVCAMIDLTEKRPLPMWLIAAIIVAPLIRYEMLGISLGAVGLLCLHRKYSYLPSVGIILIALGSFSFYLWQHTGSPLPASVTAKLEWTSGSINVRRIRLAALLMAWLMFQLRKQPNRVLLCAYVLCVLLAHLAFGKSGWLSRYEIYALISAGLVLLYYLPISGALKLLHPPICKVVAAFLLLAFSHLYVRTTLSVPAASHYIYSQQGQMRRLLEDANFPDVAVNDIGYISFRNKAYVLDLWGLGQLEIQRMRRENRPGWLSLVSNHNIPLVMTYSSLYPPSAIPKNWILMGTLETEGSRFFLSPLGQNQVAIYGTTPASVGWLKTIIAHWQRGLPSDVRWHPKV